MHEEVTPDSLMEQFKGRGLKPILIFTLVVHVVVILGSSLPFLVGKAFRSDNTKLAEAERMKRAVEEASAAIREIAKDHGLNPQDISSQFTGGRPPATEAETPASTDTPQTDEVGGEPEPEREKSEYEKNLETKAEGPAMPTIGEQPDDIF